MPEPLNNTLETICGLTREELEGLISFAVRSQKEPNNGTYQIYKAEIGGVAYQVEYGRGYMIRAKHWNITFSASNMVPFNGEPWMEVKLISKTAARLVFNPSLQGDAERFKHDMTLMKLFLS